MTCAPEDMDFFLGLGLGLRVGYPGSQSRVVEGIPESLKKLQPIFPTWFNGHWFLLRDYTTKRGPYVPYSGFISLVLTVVHIGMCEGNGKDLRFRVQGQYCNHPENNYSPTSVRHHQRTT